MNGQWFGAYMGGWFGSSKAFAADLILPMQTAYSWVDGQLLTSPSYQSVWYASKRNTEWTAKRRETTWYAKRLAK